MSTDLKQHRGRPRAVSRNMLEESAFELFLEQGYAKTSIEDITRRAGVSRNTFFNYFDLKSDVFWVEIDRALGLLPEKLALTESSLPPAHAIVEAFADCTAELGSGFVPWILTNFEAIGEPDELLSSAFSRFNSTTRVLKGFVAQRLNIPVDSLECQVIANTSVSAVAAAAVAWGKAGVSRAPLQSYLVHALAPLAEGYAHFRAIELPRTI